MTENNQINAKVNIEVAGAVGALAKARKAFRELAAASEDSGKKMTQSQRMATKAIIDEYKKLTEAESKLVKSAKDTQRKLREIELKGINDRKNARTKAGLTGAATAQGIIIKAEGGAAAAKIVAQSRVQYNINRALTEQYRAQGVVQDQIARRQQEHFRNELALRKQIFREQQALNAAAKDGEVGLNGMRYLLADVGQSMAILGAAALVLPVAATATAVSWEREFANVIRTTGVTGDRVEGLKGQFVDLVQSMPISWEKLAEIGTLAGQLGIGEQAIGKFTKTVAMFSATTDVSVEMSATAFGRLNALLPDVQGNFGKLGDSILKVGVNSIATEAQIIKITTQIAAIAGPAGFSSEEVIGLSGALASVGVPPELSRGVVTRVFGLIGKSATMGGTALEKWGNALGMSGEEFRKSWRDDAAGTFQKFMTVIKDQGSDAAITLNQLGITSVRDVPILMRLASAADSAGKAGGLLAQTMRDAKNAGGEMQKQYNIIGGTVSAKFQVFVQTFQSLLDAVGSKALPAFGDILDGWSESLKDLSRNMDEPIKLLGMFELPWTQGEGLAMATALIAGVAGLALMTAAFARIVQGAIAFKLMMVSMPADMSKLAGTSQVAATRIANAGLVTQQFSAKAGVAARASGLLRGALTSIGSAGVMAALIAVPMAIDAINESIAAVGTSAKDMANDMLTAGGAANALENITIADGRTGKAWKEVKVNAADFVKQLDLLEEHSNKNMWERGFLGGNVVSDMAKGTRTLDKMNAGFADLIAAGNTGAVFSNVRGLAADLNLTDTALSRLIYDTPVLNDLFTDTFNQNGIAKTEEAIVKLGREGLAGFGIEADAAGAHGDDFNEMLTESEGFTENFIKTLTEASGAFVDFSTAIADSTEEGKFNLSTFMDSLRQMAKDVEAYQSGMGELAGRGASSAFMNYLATLGPEAAQLIQGFVANPAAFAEAERLWVENGGASAVGWAGEMQKQSALFEEVGRAFGQKTRDQMAAEFAKGDAKIPEIMARYQRALDAQPLFPHLSMWDAEKALAAWIAAQQTRVINIAVRTHGDYGLGDGGLPQSRKPGERPDRGGFTGGQFAGGGYTGDGGKYKPAGTVHKGEFVFTKESVDGLGTSYLYNLMRAGSKGYSGGGTVAGYATGGAVAKSGNSYVPSFGNSAAQRRAAGTSNSPMQVELSPIDRQLMKDAGNLQFIIPGAMIAKATSANNIKSASRGK